MRGRSKRRKDGSTVGANSASGLPPLYRRAYRILGNAADAEDAVQDALLAAHMHLHQFRGQAKSLPGLPPSCLTPLDYNYVGGQDTSLCLSTNPPGTANQFPVSERLADQRPNPEDECRESELSARLTQLHSHLSPRFLRRTFQLRDVDGLSGPRNCCRILGSTNRHCEGPVSPKRLRQRLKQLMRRHSLQAAVSQAAKSIAAVSQTRRFIPALVSVTRMVRELLVVGSGPDRGRCLGRSLLTRPSDDSACSVCSWRTAPQHRFTWIASATRCTDIRVRRC